MAINPPFNLIPFLTQPRKLPAQSGIEALGQLGQGAIQGWQARQEREHQAIADVFKNFDVKPQQPGESAPGLTLMDVLSTMNRGRTPKNVSPEMGAMGVVPKSETNMLSRILPSIISHQAPGQETSVEGGLVKPGSIPGLSSEATITGKESTVKPKDRLKELDSISGQASNAARASIGQMIQQASANPASANVKNFPILDPSVSKQQFFKEYRREMEARGASEEEIAERVGKMSKDYDKEAKSFKTDLDQGLKLAQRQPTLKVTVKKRLLETYPLFTSAINEALK